MLKAVYSEVSGLSSSDNRSLAPFTANLRTTNGVVECRAATGNGDGWPLTLEAYDFPLKYEIMAHKKCQSFTSGNLK